MSLLRIWFAGTALIVIGALVWSFAPILIPIFAVAIGMGGLVAGIVALARKLERPRNQA